MTRPDPNAPLGGSEERRCPTRRFGDRLWGRVPRGRRDAAVAAVAPGVTASSLPTTVVSLEGRVLLVNDAYCQLVGRPRGHLLELTVADLVHPEDVEHDLRLLRSIASGRLRAHERRRRYLLPDGVAVQGWIHASPVHDEDGRPVAALVHVLERAAAPALAAVPLTDEQSFQLLFVSHPQPMWIFDLEDHGILEVNDAACTHYGYTRREFLSLTIEDIRPANDVAALHAFLSTHPTGLRRNGMFRHCRANGEVIEVEGTTNSLVFGDQDALLVTVQDVTQRNALERQLMDQALHHPLTRLPNRALFLDRLDRALDGAGPGHLLCVLDVDVDDFHLVNEAFGHEEGDAVLAALANKVAQRVPSGATVASITGEELALCIPDLPDDPSAFAFARQIQKLVEEPITRADGSQLALSASIGVATTTDTSADAVTLLRDAALGLSRAKDLGSARVAAASDDGTPRRGRRHVLARQRLREAIENGEIVPYYQPVVSLQTHTILGAEALARWADPERGLVGPSEFIPLAEETRLIVPLGSAMLERVCTDAAFSLPETNVEGRPFVVSVNVSGHQAGDGALAPLVRHLLEDTRIAPERLALEVTETALIEESENARRELEALRELGVHLSLDDFGTGYSSLTRLGQHPFDIVKIDRSFVTGMHEDDRRLRIVAGAISLATSLGSVVIAEGVESPSEAARLGDLGVRFAQGYHFHQPMPLDELQALLAADGRHPRPAPAP